MKTYAERIKYALKEAGMNQHELASIVGCKAATINYLCTGHTASSTSNARIARALNVDAFWLECGEGEPFTSTSLPDRVETIMAKLPNSQLETVVELCKLFTSNIEPVDAITVQNVIHALSLKNKGRQMIHA